MPERILILGATSDLALAVARRYAVEGAVIAAVGRNSEALARVVEDLSSRGAGKVHALEHDLSEVSAEVFQTWLAALGGCDLMLLAYGEMPEQEEIEADVDTQQRLLRTNFSSACGWLQLTANAMLAAGGGQIGVISSVAADRPRKPNFAYGATKAGLAFYAEGLGLKLAPQGVEVCVIKPGQTRTRMTAHLDTSGGLWAEPEAVARSIQQGFRKRRRTIYAPGRWRWIMLAIRHIPHLVFRRLNF